MTVFSCSGRFGPQVKSLLTPTFGTRSDSAEAKAIIEEFMPGMSDNPMMSMVEDLPLSEVLKMPQANLTDEQYEQIKQRFNSL